LAWFCGLRASWMTFAAIPEARTFLNMPAMVFLLGSSLIVPGEHLPQPRRRESSPRLTLHAVHRHSVEKETFS
jgi:hypothetical protein